jgi:protein tyrosine phosphatase (PTP) superfamily phosphohydrolase (DUF442 family)
MEVRTPFAVAIALDPSLQRGLAASLGGTLSKPLLNGGVFAETVSLQMECSDRTARMRSPLGWLVIAMLLALRTANLLHGADAALASVATPLESTNCQNFFRVSPRIFSGSQPEGEVAFEELARLGVKTLISVDGARPDIEAARRFGLRYVHLPFGYGGIPTHRVSELAQAAATLPTPIYVHCHHGKHRGPAATAVMCLAQEGWTPARAESWLRQAGTALEYGGLYAAVVEFKMPASTEISGLKALPEAAAPSPVVAAMVEMDAHLEHLKAAQKSGWSAPLNHSDITPAQAAVLLWEQLRELGRHADTANRPVAYREKLTASEQEADRLRMMLNGSLGADLRPVDAAFGELLQSCSTCHQAFRN